MNLPICKNPKCNNSVSYTKKGKLSIYCSLTCKGKENARLSSEKRKCTNLEKYGVDNPSKKIDIIDKIKKTNIEKYGVEFHWQIPQVKENIKKTNLEKYGVDNVMKNETIKSRLRNNLLKKYGVDNVKKLDSINKKSIETCQMKYGVDNVLQLDEFRCPDGIHISQKHLDQVTIQILQDKEKLKELNETMNLTEIGEHIGTAKTTISERFKRFELTPKIHYNSRFQKEVKDFVGICKTDKKRIYPFELDILLDDKKLAIECNGTYWHSELNGKDKKYHLTKTILCDQKGIQLLHIWEHDWITKKDICKSIIDTKLGKSTTIGARNTKIIRLNREQEIAFFNKTHIQGYITSKICYGLEHKDKIIAAMSFGKSRFNKKYEWELLRFSNELNMSVCGGAQRLFSIFKKENKPISIISYCHRHLFSGEIYKLLGMKMIGWSAPAFQYIKGNKIFSRLQFQKHKLKDKLINFDPKCTEWENMQVNGYDRIWDCGNSVWAWINNKEEFL